MAAGALCYFGADTATAITGIAGPSGERRKAQGTVCFTVLLEMAEQPLETSGCPGTGRDIRERSTTVMHLKAAAHPSERYPGLTPDGEI